MGRLIVTVLGCRDIQKADALGGCDPYLVISCSGKSFQTETKSGELHPVYNEQFHFFIADSDLESVCVELFDADSLSSDDALSSITLSLEGLQKGVETTKWYKFNDELATTVGISLLIDDTIH